MNEDSFKRYRFSVPKADVSVTEWINAQANLSFSLRQLIKEHIVQHGVVDVTCMAVGKQPRPGRPTNAELEARAAAMAEQAPAISQSAAATAEEPRPAAFPDAAPAPKASPAPQDGGPRTPTFVDPLAILNGQVG